MTSIAHFHPFNRPDQRHAQLLSVEFPKSFRQTADLVSASKRCRRLRQAGHVDYPARAAEALNGIDTLRTYLLFENFYYRALKLNLWSTPELLSLARTSSDWRVVYFLALMDADYPEHEADYDFLLNLLASHSSAIGHASSRFDYPVQNIA